MSARGQIEDQAAHWLVRRDGVDWDAADQAGLDAWLDESLAHKAAFWRLEHGWRAADRVAAVAPSPPRRRPLAAVRGWASRHRRALPTALAASIALAVAVPAWVLQSDRATAPEVAYRTAVGQARTIATADGSRIEMNTATVVRTRILADSREVWLDRGEAFFDIRHDENRPFRVHAGAKTVTVLGTRFSIRRDGDTVTVAVVSGRVRIDDDAAQTATSRYSTVSAGDVAVAAGRSTLVTVDAMPRVEGLTAWRDGMVVFDRTPLDDAVTEFNRYTATPIVIDDRAVGQFRIGGAFRLDNSEGFLRLLESAYDLDVTRDERAIHLRKAP